MVDLLEFLYEPIRVAWFRKPPLELKSNDLLIYQENNESNDTDLD